MGHSIIRTAAGIAVLGLLAGAAPRAQAAITLTDTVGPSGKFLVTGVAVNATSPGRIKIVFGNLTAGVNLQLCAGTGADFAAGTCAVSLSSSGGPGFNFLTIVEAPSLNGKILFVKRAVGSANAAFTLTVE
jgi:hypothetical protein